MKSNAQYQAEYRIRMYAEGYIKLTLYVKKDKKEQVKKYVGKLNAKP